MSDFSGKFGHYSQLIFRIGDRTKYTTYPIDTSGHFLAPPNLPDGNRCTDCHAGRNAFIIHPNTPLETARNQVDFTQRNNWYTPIVQSNWPQNPEPLPYPTGNSICSNCHNDNPGEAGRLPNILGGVDPRNNLYKYCSFLLPNELTPGIPSTTSSSSNILTGPMNAYVPGLPIFGYSTTDVALLNICSSLPHLTPLPTTTANWLVPVYPVPPSP